MYEVHYVDGPVVFTTTPLIKLIRNPRQTWFGLQHVLRVTYYKDIVDYELLLYVVLTDQLDIRSRYDSYQGQLKLFLTYEDCVKFYSELQTIVQQIINAVLAGGQTSTYALAMKNHNFTIQGFIDQMGQPKVRIGLQKPHGPQGFVDITVYKFQELVACFGSVINGWHNTLTLAYYQFDRLGKGLVHVKNEINQDLRRLESKLDMILQSIQHINDDQTNKTNTQIEIQESLKKDIVQKESKQVEAKGLSIEVDLQKVRQTEDEILNKLEQICQTKKENSQVDLPLSLIEHISQLENLIVNESNIVEFVKENEDKLREIFIKSGIPETMVDSFPNMLKLTIALKNIFTGQQDNSLEATILSEVLGGAA